MKRVSLSLFPPRGRTCCRESCHSRRFGSMLFGILHYSAAPSSTILEGIEVDGMLCPLNYCTTKKECDHCCGRIKKHLSFPIPERKKSGTRFFFFFLHLQGLVTKGLFPQHSRVTSMVQQVGATKISMELNQCPRLRTLRPQNSRKKDPPPREARWKGSEALFPPFPFPPSPPVGSRRPGTGGRPAIIAPFWGHFCVKNSTVGNLGGTPPLGKLRLHGAHPDETSPAGVVDAVLDRLNEITWSPIIVLFFLL
ncbi:hypothetical protein LZ32DRAFT_359309 [Colletotrichum eremochloae]|nr:hypothetical protein LZ32DRAFT_359309 [Colletotrichum eremochloae]